MAIRRLLGSFMRMLLDVGTASGIQVLNGEVIIGDFSMLSGFTHRERVDFGRGARARSSCSAYLHVQSRLVNVHPLATSRSECESHTHTLSEPLASQQSASGVRALARD